MSAEQNPVDVSREGIEERAVQPFQLKQPLFRIPLIFNFGSGAGRILSQIDTSKFNGWKVAVNNSERDLELLEEVNQRICTGEDRSGSGMNLEKARKDFQHDANKIPTVVRERCEKAKIDIPDIIPIIATLGHGFGSGSLPEAAKLLKQKFPKSVLFVFAVTPFSFQGGPITERAKMSLRACRDYGITTTPISNQSASKKLNLAPQTLALSKIYHAIKNEISDLLSSLFDALTAKSGIVESMDRNDLARIWAGESSLIMKASYGSIGSISPKSIEDAEKHLFVDMNYGNPGRNEPLSTATYIIDGPGEITIGQLESINRILVEKYQSSLEMFKPLIVQRKRDWANFILIRGRVSLQI